MDRRVFFARTDSDSLSEACATCPTSKHCCYRVQTIVVVKAEMHAIVEHYGGANLFEDRGQGLFTVVKDAGAACPFLSKHETCSIYEHRPKDCRSWPLTLQSPPRHGHFSADSACPEIEAERLPAEFIEGVVSTLAGIPTKDATFFAELVHRDETVLPLVPVDLSFVKERR